MKYCVKCGNRMEDDMLFCQKCGTKSTGGNDEVKNGVELKLNAMKQYNLALDSNSVTWEYLCEDGSRAGTIALKQDEMSEKLAALISDILQIANSDNKDLVEREVYTFALESACKLCRESEQFYADYTGFEDVYRTAKWAADINGKPESLLAAEMYDLDYPYKTVVGLQGLYASRLKGVLDENVIYQNLEYRALTKELAEAFNAMWKAGTKRYIDFLSSVPVGIIDQSWEFYETILKGLPIFIIDALDESGWELAINDVAINQGDVSYKQTFLQKRSEQRDSLRKLEDDKYWSEHPSEYEKYLENTNRISNISASIKIVEAELQPILDRMEALNSHKDEQERKIEEAHRRIDKLNGKIFGKKKAAEEIPTFQQAIIMAEKEIGNICEKMKSIQEEIFQKEEVKRQLQEECEVIKKENISLRNKF